MKSNETTAEKPSAVLKGLFDYACGLTTDLDETARAGYEDQLRLLRRERADRPVVYVGAGTCGLGAGAGKTLNAIRTFFRLRNIDA